MILGGGEIKTALNVFLLNFFNFIVLSINYICIYISLSTSAAVLRHIFRCLFLYYVLFYSKTRVIKNKNFTCTITLKLTYIHNMCMLILVHYQLFNWPLPLIIIPVICDILENNENNSILTMYFI